MKKTLMPPKEQTGIMTPKFDNAELKKWLFLIHYKVSENQKNGFFTVFWGDLEGAGTLCPPRTQATFKSPAPLGLITSCNFNFEHGH